MSPLKASRRRCPVGVFVATRRDLPSFENSSLVQSREIGLELEPLVELPLPLERPLCVTTWGRESRVRRSKVAKGGLS